MSNTRTYDEWQIVESKDIMQISGPQLKELQEALISAFPTRQDLSMMVTHGLDENLSVIAGDGSLAHTVHALLQWANARAKCEELIKAALRQNGENPQLVRVATQLGVKHDWTSPGTPAPTLPHLWNIPYPRNPFFTGQEAVLMQLTTALKQGEVAALSQPQAITGLGGIGKTQIALEYAYQHAPEYEVVLWVLADTRESLVSGYIALAQLLNLPQKDEQDPVVIIQAVKSWLQNNGSWLLILDNADELAMVREFIPSMFGGHILLTTREWSMGKQASRVELETMPIEVGALFLLRRAGLVGSDALLEDALLADVGVAKTICKELGGLPLALNQAGAYIEDSQCGLANYLASYRKRRRFLLSRRGGYIDDHPLPVAATWSLAFEKVEQRSAMAADLLRVCAFLAPDIIPEEIIVQGAGHLGPSFASVAEDDGALDDALVVLLAYSLVRRNVREKTLSLHRLVQAVLKDAMDEQARRQWAERVVLAVNAAFPFVELATWPQCERCLPHALVCVELVEDYQLKSVEAARLLNATAYYLYDRARYAEAEALYQRALKIVEEQLGLTHPNTANSLNNLAELYRARGKYAEAEPLYQRALAISEEQLGPTHPNTASSLNNLALLYDNQGRYAEAEPLYQRALLIVEEQLGPTHPSTASSLNNLALLYKNQGKYAEAEPLYQRALVIKEEQLGPMHPSTARSLNNLAGLYDAQGRYAEAEALLQQALSIREQALGPDHPDTALSVWWLAVVSEQEEQYEKAEQLYRRALAVFEQTLGEAHPHTQNLQQRYVSLLEKMGRNEA